MKKILLAALGIALAFPAFAQNAVVQEGTVLQNSPVMFSGDRRVRQGAGSGGAAAGRMVTGGTGVVGAVCAFTATTDVAYSKLCLDPDAASITLNGVNYPLSAGGGNILAPSPSGSSGHIVLWNGGLTTRDSGVDFTEVTQGNVGTTIPYAVLPVYARMLMAKTYDSTYNTYFNLFQNASYAKGLTTAAVVAQFGQGESALSGNTSWGGNHAGVASVSGAIAIAEELNPVVVASGGKAYGLVIAAAGSFATGAPAIQIQTNTAAATFGTGINFNNAVFPAITGALIQADSTTVAQNGINLGGTYSVGEIAVPSFGVAATPVNINSKLLVTASAAGNPSISVAATGVTPATNGNLILNPLGTGEVQVNGPIRIVGGKDLNMTSGGVITSAVGVTATHGINLLGAYTVGEINTQSFGVGITPVSINAKVLVTGSATGNPSISAAAAGSIPATNANLILNPLGTGEVQVNGILSASIAVRHVPISAPASPAAGWIVYTDSGDLNKLKAKASTGTVVTLGTP